MPEPKALRCPRCRYDLSGTELPGVCPECGNAWTREAIEARDTRWMRTRGWIARRLRSSPRVTIVLALVFAAFVSHMASLPAGYTFYYRFCTGLGLALCRAIVESHHGTLCAESEEGSGASFLIRLPLHRSVRPDPAGIDEGLDGVHVDIRLPAGQERDVLCAMLESAGAVTTAYKDTADVILVCSAIYKGELAVPCVVLDDYSGRDLGDAIVLQRPFVRDDLERALVLALRKPAGGGGGGDE